MEVLMTKKAKPAEPKVRMMRENDLDVVVKIDASVSGQKRYEYYQRKIELALSQTQQLITSMVIEEEGEVVGFILGELYLGEFGVPESTATIDTIGVDPIVQGHGIGTTLIQEYASYLRRKGVKSIHTRVNWNDWNLLSFFEKIGFSPAKMVTLELGL
jgi:ribosomal protein S18 acetylase RimI-like enzyme